jgi:hypothetical protein
MWMLYIYSILAIASNIFRSSHNKKRDQNDFEYIPSLLQYFSSSFLCL